MMAAGWVHAVAAAAWVGGSIFFALVLRPATAAKPDLMRPLMGAVGGMYRDLVDASVIAIVVSGLVLMFNRLTGNSATPAYFIVLGVKLAVAIWMFYAVWELRRSGWLPRRGGGVAARLSWLLGYNAVVVAGVVVYLLAGVLGQLFEAAIQR